VAKDSPLWDDLVAAIRGAFNTGWWSGSPYPFSDEATVFALVSDQGERLCEVRIENQFIQVDGLNAVADVSGFNWREFVRAHLFADKPPSQVVP
jgi:hypothetical protein